MDWTSAIDAYWIISIKQERRPYDPKCFLLQDLTLIISPIIGRIVRETFTSSVTSMVSFDGERTGARNMFW